MFSPRLAEVRNGRVFTKTGLDVTKLLRWPASNLWIFMRTAPIWLRKICIEEKNLSRARDGDLKKYNNYLLRTITKMHKYAIEGKTYKFNSLFYILTLKSKAWRLHMIADTFPKFSKDWSQKKMKITWKLVDQSLKLGDTQIQTARVILPKPDGGVRNLTVPSPSWRIISRWYHLWVNMWCTERYMISQNQFGAIKGRNTAQAWRAIWTKAIKAPFIVGFDIAKQFDSINTYQLWLQLKNNCLPPYLLNWIMGVIHSAPTNISEKQHQEEQFKVHTTRLKDRYCILKHLVPWYEIPFLKVDQWYRDYKEAVKEKKKNALRNDYQAMLKMFGPMYLNLKKSGAIKNNHPKVDKPSEMSERTYQMYCKRPNIGSWTWFVKNVRDTGEYGIPQGWALSPLLANIAIAPIAKKFANALFYVDDGLMIGGKEQHMRIEELLDELETKGMTLAYKKFEWIKWDGEWLRDLRFLGMKYVHSTKEWVASTKSGKKITVPRPPMSMLAKGIDSYFCSHKIMNWMEVNRRFGISVDLITYAYQDGKRFTDDGWVDIEPRTLWGKIMRRHRAETQCIARRSSQVKREQERHALARARRLNASSRKEGVSSSKP